MAKRDFSGWTKEELIRELRKAEKRKKYGIVWEDKPEKVAELCKEKLPVLSEDKTKEIRTDDERPANILIEGDNYHALSVLNYTHKGKIDVIYIDPPYNTGAKDWKYNNHYVDSNDQWRHSKWLSFMEKRLKLAKKLLKRNGVLICTIDKHEHSALGLLLQELFPNREIVCVTIIHNPGGIQGKNFSKEFPQPDIWDKFNDVYGGKYSKKLRDEIIESMKNQAKNLSEDPMILEECLMATGQFDEPNSIRLPCYAEKARYEYYTAHKGKSYWELEELNESELGPTEIEPCWIFVINWGMGGEPLGHIKTYIISTVDYAELFYQTCK